MPRSPRIEYENAYYHVMNRGFDKNQIFYNDKSYEIFLEILGEACEKFEVIVHSYCLMSNHYHLLVQTPKANLSKFMQHFIGCYTQRLNKFAERDGPLFRGRFKSKLVEDENYFIGLNRYIHRNPLDLMQMENLQFYRWSSYPSYLGLAECQPWLDQKKTLTILEMTNRISSYKEFIEYQGVRPLGV